MLEFRDLRGIRDVVIAPLTTDTKEELTYGDVTPFVGAESLSSEVNESSGTKYYDNAPRIITNAEGEDNYTLTSSQVDDSTRATVEGGKYDQTLGMYVATPKKRPYVAFGFVAEDTNGKEWGYWVLKTKISGGAESHNTKNNGTDSNGLEWNIASIYTNHVFEKADGKPAKYCKVDLSKVDETVFFSKVTNPDEVVAKSE